MKNPGCFEKFISFTLFLKKLKPAFFRLIVGLFNALLIKRRKKNEGEIEILKEKHLEAKSM
jgi:hypothetical protein